MRAFISFNALPACNGQTDGRTRCVLA